MLKRDDAENLARLFSALGSDTRVRILQELQGRQLCVGALAMRLELTQGAISQHLKILRNAELVVSDKRGSYVHYQLAPGAREQCQAALNDVVPESQTEEGQNTCS